MATTETPKRPRGRPLGSKNKNRDSTPRTALPAPRPQEIWQTSVLDMAASWIDQPMDEHVCRMKFTPDMQKKVCIHYAQHGNLSRACVEVGVNRATAQLHLKDDPIFAGNMEMAKDLFVARLEDAAIHRAIIGEEQPIVQKGEIIGYKRVTSDSLLTLLLKANAPNKYGDKVKLEATTGGVLVLPLGTPPTQDDWLEQNENKQLPPAIDAHSEEKTE